MKRPLTITLWHEILRVSGTHLFPVSEKDLIFKRRWLTKKQEKMLETATKELKKLNDSLTLTHERC